VGDTAAVRADNVEIARGLMDAFFSRDVAGVFAALHPGIEFRPPPEFPGDAVYHGYDGMWRAFGVWIGMGGSLEYDTPQYIDAGGQVLVATRQRGKAESGAHAQAEVFNLFTLDAGKVVRFEMFFERGAALAAAGLSSAGPDGSR
jgi:ketosteroid isomerase-like protein